MRRLALELFRRLPRPLRLLVVRALAPSYTVGAVVILRRSSDGAVLLLEQRHLGGWALPGGLLKRGEAPVDALLREVCEELDLQLSRDALPPPVASVDPVARRVDLVYLLDDADADGVRRADPAEITGIGWYQPSQLPVVTEPTLGILRVAGLR